METEYPGVDSRVLEEDVVFDDHVAASDIGQDVPQKQIPRASARAASARGYTAVPSTSDDVAIHSHQNNGDHLDAQPITFSKQSEFGTLSSQHAEGEHPAYLGYVSVPRSNLSEASRWTRISTETWFWELCGILVSLVGVASICGVLLAYGDKPAPRLPHHITLNAVVSILGTISKASLAFSLAAVLGQKKWLRYQEKAQKLQHMQSFDDATRGPLGSLNLMLAPSMESSTRMVAFVLLASIATDPFFQQLLSYPARSVPSVHLTASINETIGTPSSNKTNPELLSPFTPDTISSAVGAGIYNQDLTPRIPPTCPTGDCVWMPYHALSFCSKCEDITDSVDIMGISSQNYFNNSVAKILSTLNMTFLEQLRVSYDISQIYKRTNGSFILKMPTARIYESEDYPTQLTDDSEGVYSSTVKIPYQFHPEVLDVSHEPPSQWTLFGSETTTRRRITAIKPGRSKGISDQEFAGIKNPLAAFSSITLTEAGVLSEVLECAVALCVHKYDTFVTTGNLTSSPLSTTYGTFGTSNTGLVAWTAIVGDRRYTLSENSLFNMNAALCDAVLGTVTGTRYPQYGFYHEKGGMHVDSITGATGSTLTPSSLEISAINNQGNFSEVLTNIASSLNNYLQRYATDQIPGQVLVQETYVHVRWPWLVLPLALVIVGILTLLQTIWQTRRQKAVVWKSSILPLLYRGPVQLGSIVNDKAALPESRSNTVAAMYGDAKGVRVRLVREGEMGEWRLKEIG